MCCWAAEKASSSRPPPLVSRLLLSLLLLTRRFRAVPGLLLSGSISGAPHLMPLIPAQSTDSLYPDRLDNAWMVSQPPTLSSPSVESLRHITRTPETPISKRHSPASPNLFLGGVRSWTSLRTWWKLWTFSPNGKRHMHMKFCNQFRVIIEYWLPRRNTTLKINGSTFETMKKKWQ